MTKRTALFFIQVVAAAAVWTAADFSYLYAESLDFQYIQSLRAGRVRDDNGYVHRLSINKYPVQIRDDIQLLLSPFWEGNWNIDSREWYRQDAGLETGIRIWDYFYVAESCQYAWRDVEKYAWDNPEKDSQDADIFELVTKLKGTSPFYNWLGLDWGGYFFSEFGYNVNNGRGYKNEMGAGINLKINDMFEIPFGWRHTDRLHKYDTDQGEISVVINF